MVGVRPLHPLPFTQPSPPVERRRRGFPLLPAAGVAAALLGALLLTTARPAGHAPTPVAAASPTPSPTPSRIPTTAELVGAALTAQSRALLAGDLPAYLAPVDPALTAAFTRRYTSLRALGVAVWTPRVTGAPQPRPDGQWAVQVTVEHCFGAVACVPVQMLLDTVWTVQPGRTVVTAHEQTTAPWDLAELQGVTGRRVVVVASAANAGKLARTLTAADRAADIADRYARWDPAPARYVVYLATPAEWDSWWGRPPAGRADAYHMGLRGVVLRAAVDPGEGLMNLLAHEFTHVLSLGDRYGSSATWWLEEGLAEYVADRDGSWTKDRLPFVRRYLARGRWDGSLTLGPMPEGVSADDWYARYGLALLTVDCLAERYGEDKMIDFFGSVVRRATALDPASLLAFDTDWPSVAAACTARIRARAA